MLICRQYMKPLRPTQPFAREAKIVVGRHRRTPAPTRGLCRSAGAACAGRRAPPTRCRRTPPSNRTDPAALAQGGRNEALDPGGNRYLNYTVVRYSQLFPKTLREVPKGVSSVSYRLLFRGGYIRYLGRGLFSFLPLGLRVLRRLEAIIREELNKLGGQEVLVPIVNPFSIWKRSGRHRLIDRDMVHFNDRFGRKHVLATTHEEAMVEMLRLSLNSYRDLPVFLYQFQEKFRDEERTRSGLVRSREFVMKDAYSFHRSFTELNNFFPQVFRAYMRIFRRCRVPTIVAEAGVGYMGGERSYEFLSPSTVGDDYVITCSRCGYSANREVAVAARKSEGETPRESGRVRTPGCDSMAKLSEYLGLGYSHLAKTMVYSSGNGLVMAVVRADQDVSLEKLGQSSGEAMLRPATEHELRRHGLVPGYLSPLAELDDEVTVVVDQGAAATANLVYGANEENTHVTNVNFGRDYEAHIVADIARAAPGYTCLHCGGPLHQWRALELGNIFRLSKYYTRSMDLWFRHERGYRVYPYMGSYGIGLGRLMAAIVEMHHDEDGIVWPVSVAPFMAYLMSIGKSIATTRIADRIAEELGDDVLYDDRTESIGAKFKDCALLGIPYRIVVTNATQREGTVEILERKTGRMHHVPVEQISERIAELVEAEESKWRSS